jgi:uncharacterized protein (TIGR03437 family)
MLPRYFGLFLTCCTGLCAQSFSFLPGVKYPAGSGSTAIAQGDFNGDGNLDLAIGNVASNSISIYLGNGQGSFTAGATIPVPNCTVGFLAAADFNKDHHIDLLGVCEFQGTAFVAPGLGTGQFGTPISTTLPGVALYGFSEGDFQTVAVADFNNDGVPDLIVGLADTNFDSDSYSLNLYLGKGDGTFQSSRTIVSPGGFLTTTVLTADFDRDGNQDLLVGGAVSDVSTPQYQVFLGKGDGTFQAPASLSVPVLTVLGAATVADVNADGLPDLVLVGPQGTSGPSTLYVFLGTGAGAFKQSFSVQEASGQSALGLVTADLRGTGHPDLVEVTGNVLEVVTGLNFAVQVRPGNGDGTFGIPVAMTFPSGLSPWPSAMLAGFWSAGGEPSLAFAALPAGATLPTGNSDDPAQSAVNVIESLPAGNLVVIPNGSTPSPKLSVSPSQVQFAYVQGSAQPTPQSVSIGNTGGGTLTWTASANQPWLAISPASGSGPGNLSVQVLLSGLSAGTYTGAVQVSATSATASPQTISVTLTVSAATGGPVITAVVNGASFQTGFESGSWVTIVGTGLSNTNPGRTWTAAEIPNGNLPTSLDNTSVTIDGIPAYVYYISPGQLNVQAPSDTATGSVAVVVKNNGQSSAPFNAQLATYSPAFFQFPGTSYAIASHYPDYALVGNPNAVPGTVAAHPGDILILWATGFGPTTPTTPAGVVVTGAPAVGKLATVTVGGTPVTVVNTVLSPGSAGLYQVVIQLPTTLASGVLPIQASVSGANSPSGISIYVSGQ